MRCKVGDLAFVVKCSSLLTENLGKIVEVLMPHPDFKGTWIVCSNHSLLKGYDTDTGSLVRIYEGYAHDNELRPITPDSDLDIIETNKELETV